jgi:hypothetical protein
VDAAELGLMEFAAIPTEPRSAHLLIHHAPHHIKRVMEFAAIPAEPRPARPPLEHL